MLVTKKTKRLHQGLFKNQALSINERMYTHFLLTQHSTNPPCRFCMPQYCSNNVCSEYGLIPSTTIRNLFLRLSPSLQNVSSECSISCWKPEQYPLSDQLLKHPVAGYISFLKYRTHANSITVCLLLMCFYHWPAVATIVSCLPKQRR